MPPRPPDVHLEEALLEPEEGLPVIARVAAVEVVADKASKQLFAPTAGVTQKLVDAMLERGLFTRVVLDAVCLAPPLVTTEAQLDAIVEAVGSAIDSVVTEVAS